MEGSGEVLYTCALVARRYLSRSHRIEWLIDERERNPKVLYQKSHMVDSLTQLIDFSKESKDVSETNCCYNHRIDNETYQGQKK